MTRPSCALVTGAAGFIGSTLVDTLAALGWTVRAVDNLSDYYDVGQKLSNVAAITSNPEVSFIRADLRSAPLESLLDGVDVVFHQAGQPGVRSSWDDFSCYLDANVVVTQRLLEAARSANLRRFVFASSSSIYGNATAYPTAESAVPAPHSPYGVSKLAAEHLCGVYGRNFGVPTVALRYFTVYGPRQRPDMAMFRLIRAALTGAPFPVYGDGEQIRDFTYVGDVVSANIAAALTEIEPGTVMNVAGSSSSTLNEVITIVQALTGCEVDVDRRPAQPGDVARTGGAIDAAAALLGWTPRTALTEGLAREVAWYRKHVPLGLADSAALSPASSLGSTL